MSNSLKNQVYYMVRNQTYEKIRGQFGDQVGIKVRIWVLEKTLFVEYFMQFTTKIFNHFRKNYE